MASVQKDGLWSPVMRGFLLLWMGEIVSLVGSGMTCFGQNVYVYTNLGGTIVNLMALAILAQVPGILISPLAGVLVDRWNRRLVMIIGNSVAALATLTLRLLIVSSSFELWQMYVIVVIISMANHFQWPAYFSTIPLMVPRERLKQANGLVQMGRSTGVLAAPLLAGFAVTHFKIEGIILFDMFTYLFALIMIFLVKIPTLPLQQADPNAHFSFMREILFGWRYLMKRPEYRGLLALFAFANFMFSGGMFLIIPLILKISTPEVLGSASAIEGLSMIAGGLLMSFLVEPKSKVKGIVICFFLQALAFMFVGTRPSLGWIIAGMALFCFFEPFINAYGGILWHKKIPLHVQGRVLAASGMTATAGIQLGALTVGLLGEYVFIPMFSEGGALVSTAGKVIGTGVPGAACALYLLLGLLAFLMAAAAFLYKPLRMLESRIPDAVDSAAEKEQSSAFAQAAAAGPSSCALPPH